MANKKRKKDRGGKGGAVVQQERPRFIVRAKTGLGQRLWEVYDLDDDPTLPVMEGDYTVCQNFVSDMQFLVRHGAEVATLDAGDFESARTPEGAKALRDDLQRGERFSMGPYTNEVGDYEGVLWGDERDADLVPLWQREGYISETSVVKHAPKAAVVEVAKPLDPAVKLALEKATTGYYVGVPDGGLEGLTHPVNVVLTGNGVFEVRTYQIGRSIVQLTKERVPGLESDVLVEGFTFSVPRIPWSVLSEMVAFFRHVNEKHKSEAYVQVFYDPRTGQYETHVPLQDISAGRVEHAGEFDTEGVKIHVLDCHSHHTMDGYFSSTDDNDEQRFSGRAFGVIGKITQHVPKMLWRVRAGGKFIALPITDLFELADVQPQTVTIPLSSMLKGTSETDGKMAFTIQTPDVFEGATFPAAWLEPLITARSDARWTQIPGHQATLAETMDYKTPHQRGWWGWGGNGGDYQGGGTTWGGRPTSDSAKGQAKGFYKGTLFVVKQGTGELFQLLDNGQLAKVRLQGMSVKPY